MNVMSEGQFLALRGVEFSTSGYCLDKLKSNRQLKTVNGRKRFEKECEEAEATYQKRRAAAKAEYAKLVEEGQFRPLSHMEKMLQTANGHPDNPSTQAARRMCAKRGIDWETGLPLKEVS